MTVKQMKPVFIILIIYGLGKILLSCSTSKKVLDFENLPNTVHIFDKNYEKEITDAQKYLQTIPKKINTPSFSVAVGHKGKVIWSEAIGYQDIENKIPAHPNSIYRIGSTSKAVTSVLAARLVDKGQMDLETLITDEIANYPKKEWGFTPRQLLSHSAGIPDYNDLKLGGLYRTLCNCRNYTSVTEGLKVFNKVKLLYRPGSSFKYTSFDIVLLSAYMETITKTDFLSLLNTEVLEPLEMKHTFADHSKYQKDTIVTFYKTRDNTYKKWSAFGIFNKKIDLSYKWAGGGILSTPTDLVKMGNAVLTDRTFMSRGTNALFFEPQKLDNGELNPQHYALGWRSYYEYENEALNSKVWIVHHAGISKGAMNFLILFPEYELVINASINTRTDEFWTFGNEVIALAGFFINN